MAGPPPLIQPPGGAGAQPAPAAPPAPAATPPGASVPQPPAQAVPPATPPPVTPPPAQAVPPATPPPAAAAQQAPPAQAAQVPAAPVAAQPAQPDALRIILTPPGTPLIVASSPATVPVSVFGASRMSTVTLSLRFDPKVLRVRMVQEGTFMASGGGTVTFAQQVDAAAGRVDITLTRAGDSTGVSGDGVLASVVFDAIGSGVSPLGLGGVVTAPGGLPMPVQFGQASITVR